jgi:hypothetical protein
VIFSKVARLVEGVESEADSVEWVVASVEVSAELAEG